MRKIRLHLRTGSDVYGEVVEIEDDMTDEEIQEYAEDWAWNHLSLSWEDVLPDE